MSSSRIGMLAVVIAASLSAASAAPAAVQLEGLRTAVNPDATIIYLRVSAPVEYSSAWVDARTYMVDVAGLSSKMSPKSEPLHSPLVSSYKLLSYEGADKQPHVRVAVALKSDANVQAQRSKEGLTITIAPGKASSDSQGSAAQGAPSPSDRKELPAVPLNPKRGTAIRSVQVARLEGTSDLEVQIAGDGALQYEAKRVTDPERLVVDIPNAVNQVRQKQLPVNVSPLRSVRIGQLSVTPLISRVVMDLDSQTPFEVRPERRSLIVKLGGPASAAIASATKNDPDSQPGLAPNTDAAISVDVVAEKPAAEDRPLLEAVVTPLHATPAEEGIKTEATSVQQPMAESIAASAPTPVTQWREIPNATPMPAVPSSAEPNVAVELAKASPAPVVVASAERVMASPGASPATPRVRTVALQPVAARTSEPPVLMAQQQTQVPPPAPQATQAPQTPATPQTPAGAAAAPRQYTGEPISVNLKDVDLKDFFRLIHEISGLNIVLDPNVTGSVTIVLDDVPWDQAMEIVLRNNQLGRQLEGSVVRIAKLSTLEAEEKQRRDLAVAQEQAQPKVTVTRTLSYAKAADLIPTLKKFLTERGDVVNDARTNTLIITDIPGVIPTVDRLIQSLDQKSLQVEIEARVVSASRSFARDIGSQLAASGMSGNVVLGGTGQVGESPIKRGTVPPIFIGTPPTAGASRFANLSQPLSVNLPAAGATSGLSLILSSGANFALDAIITAAESKGIGKLLSRPKIITQNNVEATVKQGVKIPLQTTVNNTVSVQYVDVVLRLTVTPQITAEGTIFLKTDIENTSIDPGISTTPGQFGLDTQSATTQVLVSNGGTVFFGGVVQNINRLNEAQVPLLGSVPLIGNLFKRRQTTSTSNELLFFITPRIV